MYAPWRKTTTHPPPKKQNGRAPAGASFTDAATTTRISLDSENAFDIRLTRQPITGRRIREGPYIRIILIAQIVRA